MELEMTWTAICKDSSGNIIHEVVNAPHGAKNAWDYIVETYQFNLIAIVPGGHEVHSEAKGYKVVFGKRHI
jgi:hypothetical protein